MSKKVVMDKKRFSTILDEITERGSFAGIPTIPVKDIMCSNNQPRKKFSGLKELADSITEKGLIEPLIVRPRGDKYEIIAGERRFRAIIQYTKIEQVPCVIRRDTTEDETLETALIENLQREDLNPIEETQAILNLLEIRIKNTEEYRKDPRSVTSILSAMSHFEGKEVGNDVVPRYREIVEKTFANIPISWQTFLKHRVPLLSLPDDLKDALIEYEGFKPAHAREIVKIDKSEIRGRLIEEVVINGVGLRELKQKIAEYQRKSEKPSESRKSKRKPKSLTFEELPNVKVKHNRNRIVFDIDYGKGDIIETLERLLKLARVGRFAFQTD